MSLEILPIAGSRIEGWAAPSWTARGIQHGFFGRGFDAAADTTSASGCELLRNAGSAPLRLLRQVHGDEIVLSCAPGARPEGDGWLLDTACAKSEGTTLFAVQTADCFPVMIIDRESREGVLLHAGWRGIVKGIVERGMSLLVKRGSRLDHLEALVGPGAQSCCYEVREDVLSEISRWEQRLDRSFVSRRGDKKYPLLQELILAQLRAGGVSSEFLGQVSICTMCDNRFFSYRREKADAGRQVSVILGCFVANKMA